MANNKNNPKEQINVEDALTQSEAFIAKNKSLIIGIVAGLIIIVAGVTMYRNMYSEPREEKAQTILAKAELYLEQNEYELALNGDSIGNIGFLAIIDQHSGTDAANLAKAYAGISYKQLGEYQKAIDMLSSFKAKDLMVAPSALGAMGNCYAELGDLDKAISYLTKAADMDNEALSPVFLIQAGNIFEKQGKFADAEKAYTKIKEKYPNSIVATDIDKYIEKAKLQKK